MVYCVKCGAKNEDDAEVCVKCGAPLYGSKRATTRREDTCFGPREEKRFEEECFGLPYGGAIFGMIFGVIILILGIAWVISLILDIAIDVWKFFGPFMVIIIGILIIAGVAYRFSRRS
jgi:ribosomal protein L40E